MPEERSSELVPSVAQMESYFNSIEDLFRTTVDYKPPRGLTEPFAGYALAAAGLSIFPVIPTIFWSSFRWGFPHFRLVLYGWNVPMDSFPLWWGLSVTLSALLLISLGAINQRARNAPRPELLGDGPMTFALAYALFKELDRYKTNRQPKHLDEARRLCYTLEDFLQKLWGRRGLVYLPVSQIPSRFPFTHPSHLDSETIGEPPGEKSKFLSFFPRIITFAADFPWFKLEPTSARIIGALDSFIYKIRWRIRDKKDIAVVSEVIVKLASYLFMQIPEVHEVSTDQIEEFETVEVQLLLSFADSIEQLPPRPLRRVRRPAVRTTEKSEARQLWDWILEKFNSDDLLVRFFTWLMMAAVLVCAAAIGLLHLFKTLKLEAVLTAALTAVFAVAAGALAAPARKRE